VARATDNQVVLDAPQGSVWQGQATLILQDQHIPPRSLGGFNWRINPFWLVTGHLPIALRGTDPARRFQADIELSLDTLVLRNVDAQLPADVIPALYPPALFFNLGGELRLTTPALELKRGAVTGQAELYWQAATTGLVKVNPLGDYRLYLNGEGARATFKLETPRGALLLIGDGQWDLASGRIDFNGVARPLGHSAELEPLLQAFGRDQGGGLRSFVASTRVLLAM
jgi:general secretion pathway protein N